MRPPNPGDRVAYSALVHEDEIWTQRIEDALSEVRGWESRTRAEPPEIDPQSTLGADDGSDPALTLSSTAWFGLQSSVDHLAQLADILTTPGGAPLRPYSPFTLTRSALLAASQTVWLLSGEDRDERLRRTALVYKDEWENHLRYLTDYKLDPAIQDSLDADIEEAIDDQMAKLNRQLGGAKNLKLGRFSSTKMLDDAARWASRHQTDGWQRRALLHEWRIGSAAAHARQWPMNFRSGNVTIDRADQMSVRWLATSYQEIGTSLGAATLMAREGFQLWDKHRHKGGQAGRMAQQSDPRPGAQGTEHRCP